MALIARHSLPRGYNRQLFDSYIGAASFLALELTDEKSEPDPEPRGSSPANSSPRQAWTPTSAAFYKLLASFSPDGDKAAQEYESTRLKLHRFFDWRRCHESDRLTDEVFDRVTRKLDEGEVISNISAYIYSVAKFIFMEWKKKEVETTLLTETHGPAVDPMPLEGEDYDQRTRCFDRCLAELPKDDRETLLEYYAADKREKIEGRTKMAERLGVTPNALRIRVHRIRKGLEKAVKICVGEIGK